MSALVALHVQQGVAVVDEAGSVGAERDVLALAVAGDEEAVGGGSRSRGPGLTLGAVGTGGAGVTTLTWVTLDWLRLGSVTFYITLHYIYLITLCTSRPIRLRYCIAEGHVRLQLNYIILVATLFIAKGGLSRIGGAQKNKMAGNDKKKRLKM